LLADLSKGLDWHSGYGLAFRIWIGFKELDKRKSDSKTGFQKVLFKKVSTGLDNAVLLRIYK